MIAPPTKMAFKNSVKGKKIIFGTNTSVAIIAFVAILVVVNYVAARHSAKWDLTENKIFTFSEQTKKILSELGKDVKITTFFIKNDPKKWEAEALLREYDALSDKLTVEFVDPDLDPSKAITLGVKVSGTIVLECQARREDLQDSDEQRITSAILKVISEQKKVVYFLQGHNEKNIEGASTAGENINPADDSSITAGDREGYSKAKTYLENQNYEVKSFSLVQKGGVPEDCQVLIIAGPETPFQDKELEALHSYLDGGGKILALLDPNPGYSLKEFLSDYGINIRDDFVVDVGANFWNDALTPAVISYSSHDIVRKLSLTFFPEIRSLELATKSEAEEADPSAPNSEILFYSSEDSWSETQTSETTVQYDPEKDIKGPLGLAAAVSWKIPSSENTQKENNEAAALNKEQENNGKTARLVVIGDSDFACNTFFELLSNYALFLNAVNWLAEEEELLSIAPKSEDTRTVQLTGQQMGMIFYTTVFGLPILVLAAGIALWWRRR